ncbi:MAG: S1 RNA-binding domain-containing protein, partial [Bacteroidales bacterium]
KLEEGVDGLVHISDLSWTKKIKHPSEFTALGDKLEVVVLEIDKDNRRLSLGHKQLEENPWDTFETIFTVGSVHNGTIVSFNEKGATVALEYGIEGFAPVKGLVKEDGTNAKAEEKLDFKVIEFNKGAKKIVLSHSRIAEDKKREANGEKPIADVKASEAETTKKAVKKVKASVEKTTLGDISELADLKKEMDKEAKAEKKEEKAE